MRRAPVTAPADVPGTRSARSDRSRPGAARPGHRTQRPRTRPREGTTEATPHGRGTVDFPVRTGFGILCVESQRPPRSRARLCERHMTRRLWAARSGPAARPGRGGRCAANTRRGITGTTGTAHLARAPTPARTRPADGPGPTTPAADDTYGAPAPHGAGARSSPSPTRSPELPGSAPSDRLPRAARPSGKISPGRDRPTLGHRHPNERCWRLEPRFRMKVR